MAQHVWNSDSTVESPDDWEAWPDLQDDLVYEEADRVNVMHPIYNVPIRAADDMKRYFSSKTGF